MLADEAWLAAGEHSNAPLYRARLAATGGAYEVLELGSEQAAYVDAVDLSHILVEQAEVARAVVQLRRRELLVAGAIVHQRSGFRLVARQVYLQLGRAAPRPEPTAPPRTAQAD
jgi:hypothetical protein